MKDKWMNVGYEDDELKPYVEPEPDFSDTRRMGKQGELSSCYTVDSFFSSPFYSCNISYATFLFFIHFEC